MAPRKELSESEKKLFDCIAKDGVEDVKNLLQDPTVTVDCLDETGMTPIQHAAYKANMAVCELLLAHGAHVNMNEHDSGYTTLMFAALSGNKEVTQLMLEAGAKVYPTNSVGRTASQMAAFVGQHEVVSLINNFFSREDLEYYTVPQGLETEPKLPPHLAAPMYRMILNNNLNPVRCSRYLEESPELLKEAKVVANMFDTLCKRVMKQKETNEVMGVKFNYLACIVRQAEIFSQQKNGSLDPWYKFLLLARPGDLFEENQEKFIRASLKEFPYLESNLLQQMIRTIAPVKIGDSPSALNVLTTSINGQRMASPEDLPCTTCGDFKAEKRCSACKMVNYCNQKCQKMHWFTHKKGCKELSDDFKRLQIQRDRLAEFERRKKELDEQEEREKADKIKEVSDEKKDAGETQTENKKDSKTKDPENATNEDTKDNENAVTPQAKVSDVQIEVSGEQS